MGTWGKGILQDDLALDVYGDFIERYNEGADPKALRAEILERYADSASAPDGRSSVWFGLARAQWECGSLSRDVLSEVKKIVSSGTDVARWQEGDRKTRQRVLNGFLARLSSPNPKPKRRIKRRVAKAIFEVGACLAVETYRGGYGAAIVLKVATDKYDTHHLVGGLEGMFKRRPSMDVYETRNWLRLTHGNFAGQLHLTWCGASSYKRDTKEHRIFEVGKTQLRADDPTAKPFEVGGVGHSGWGWIENQIWLQQERGKTKKT
jgi:hypothetical protein